VSTTPRIEINAVTHAFESATRDSPLIAVRDVTIHVDGGQFVSIVGPSGCGKSTLLGLVAGLSQPTFGSVVLDGQPVRKPRRDTGFLFQRDALLPWRTALENVILPLKFRGVERREARERGREWLARVGLADFAGSYPHQLSGGMRKRVALAATLVYEPRILLMDEPFSALDVQTRNLMENDLLHLWEMSKDQTIIFVTHDLEEAIALSDRVIVLSASPGQIVGDYPVTLPRPRDLLEVRFEDEFSQLHEKIWEILRDEVMRAHQAETLQRMATHPRVDVAAAEQQGSADHDS
jgi:NitT/TauT family transport system ATP-binding protein